MRTAIPKDDVIELFKSAGCSLLRADTVTVMPPGFDDTTFYFTKP